MDSLTSLVTFSVSMCSALFTFYFWIVKAQLERPCLKSYAIEPHLGGHAFSSCGDPIKLLFEPKLIVANYSSRPNALLSVRAWLKTCDGEWLHAPTSLESKTALPINIAPMQTVRLNFTATVEVPAIPEGEECRNTNSTFHLYREHYLPAKLELMLELTGLGKKAFVEVVQYEPRESEEASTSGRLVA